MPVRNRIVRVCGQGLAWTLQHLPVLSYDVNMSRLDPQKKKRVQGSAESLTLKRVGFLHCSANNDYDLSVLLMAAKS